MVDGKNAAEFKLKDQHGNKVAVEGLRKKLILLSFHPLAWTSICAKQMQYLDENFHKFEELSTLVYGISVDSHPSKLAWAKELGIKKLKLLSDFWPHGDVAKAFEIFRENEGISERANILLNSDLKIIFKKVYKIEEFPDFDEVFQVIKDIRFGIGV